MPEPTPPTLADHTARLLTGTGISAADAAAVAAGAVAVPAGGPAVAAALRDGWDAADPSTLTRADQ